MKNYTIISILLIFTVLSQSCVKKEPVTVEFKDANPLTINDYIVNHDSTYSDFREILQKSGLDKTLSAYNPHGLGYTLFLPDNNAIDEFINENDQFNSLDDLLNDARYAAEFAKYHIVNKSIVSDDFPFGALPAYTLSEDLLTVGFVVQPDTSYYIINNQAPVIHPNIEMSNGMIHLISKALVPITYSSYDWLASHPAYSIFKAAVDTTGFKNVINFNLKDKNNTSSPITMLMEADSIFKKNKINNINDLIAMVSPDNHDFTNPLNPLYNFVGYHMLDGNYYLDNFSDVATNYATYSDIPLNINGNSLDIYINKGKQTFDTLVNGTDSTFIDYILFKYDESNVSTQSGVIHFINRVLQQVPPSKATQTYQFSEVQAFDEFRTIPNSYLIEDSSTLKTIKYSGADLYFVQEAEGTSNAWSNDYLLIDGDFSISYTVPKIVQGSYTVYLQAGAFNSENALIEVYIDGIKIGGLIDLTSGGTAAAPFLATELGTVAFQKYEKHTVKIESLIPGRFLWDYIQFEPK